MSPKPNPTLEIFSQGEEIVSGQIVDTNAAWLSEQAVLMGFSVTRHTAVGDKLDDLIQLLRDIAGRSDCCICTGGLGPTSDDLTAEAVAIAFDLPLEFDAVACSQIEQFFTRRGRQMADCNRKQAMLPRGSLRLDNLIGTAPGFALQYNLCWFAFIPGVPSEMRNMFQGQIQALLRERFAFHPNRLITIKTIGIGESDIQQRIAKINIPPEVQLGFRAEPGEVQTKLLFPGDYPINEQQQLVHAVAEVLGDAVYAIDEPGRQSSDLASVVDGLMVEKKLSLAVLETLSYGALSAKLIGTKWLVNAVFERSLIQSIQRLGHENKPKGFLATIKALAESIKKNTHADMVLIQSIRDQGDINMDTDKPVLFINSLITEQGVYHQTIRQIAGDNKRKQQQAALLSLDLLRRYLQGKSMS